MLTGLRVENFKAWRDSGEVRLAPLTVLFGRNSAGKSSLGHLLLALKQTAASADRRCAFDAGGPGALVDLGSFVESLHRRDRRAALGVSLRWAVEGDRAIVDPRDARARFSGDELALSTTLEAGPGGVPRTKRLRYALSSEGREVLSAELSRGARGVRMAAQPYRLVEAAGRSWPLEPPEKFYRVPERSLARYENAGFLAEWALEVERVFDGLGYLGPLREPPARTYAWSGHTPESVGARGELSIACLLAADAAGRTLQRGARGRPERFSAFVARWLVDLGVIERFSVRRAGRGGREHEVVVKTRGGLSEVGLPDVGFGVSQILPVLVEAFYAPRGSTVWIEQPELHLHPQLQGALADLFVGALRAREGGAPRRVQFVVETHSEYFLDRLQRRIAEEALSHEEVAVHVVRPGRRGAELEELSVNALGDITNWPDDFFGDEMADLVARTEAAARRRARA